ncbi:MAG: hypothetical protein ACK55I_51410, partial [bacterium]
RELLRLEKHPHLMERPWFVGRKPVGFLTHHHTPVLLAQFLLKVRRDLNPFTNTQRQRHVDRTCGEELIVNEYGATRSILHVPANRRNDSHCLLLCRGLRCWEMQCVAHSLIECCVEWCIFREELA